MSHREAVIPRRVRTLVCLGMLGLLSGWRAAHAAELSAATRNEVDQLLTRVAASGCDFKRGNNWYSAADARQHLEMKFKGLAGRGAMVTAEDFIDLAASRSSITGEAYAIRCKAGPAHPSAVWLNAQLRAVRSGSIAASHPAR